MILQRYSLPSNLHNVYLIDVLNQVGTISQKYFQWYDGSCDTFIGTDENYSSYSRDFFGNFLNTIGDSLIVNSSRKIIRRSIDESKVIDPSYGSENGAMFKLMDLLHKETLHVFHSIAHENSWVLNPSLVLTFSSTPPKSHLYSKVEPMMVNFE